MYCGTRILPALLLYAAMAIAASAQSFLVISRPDIDAYSPLVEGLDGKLYGASENVGFDDGTVFKIGVFGAFTTLHEFCEDGGNTCPDGGFPITPLVLGSNGDFYGATLDGGANSGGTVYRITPAGTLTTIYNFCLSVKVCAGGFHTVGLVLGPDGSLYGANESGGDHGYGTVFKITSQGAFSVLYRFCALSGCTDGANPSSLILGTDDNLYGTTSSGGANHYWGTVFKLTPSGVLTTLHSFCARTNCIDGQSIDGQSPSGLTQASDGNFYGATPIVSKIGAATYPATFFKTTPQGATTTLNAFPCDNSGCPQPTGPLIQGTDGDLYSVSCSGINPGPDQYGSLFKVTLDGALSVLYILKEQDGACPKGLMQATNGKFYGTTGTESAAGTIFRLDMGLAPFIKTVLTLGPVGTAVTIIGSGLANTTAVSFNGAPATFTACTCGSYIKATVPAGATSGAVSVTLPSGTLSSNVAFTVAP
jgi:uncharacterized repeat protein (TIGR03803 family)